MMQIIVRTPDGAIVRLADTTWGPLAEAIETVAMRGGGSGRGPRWVEAAVLSWCRPAHRPAVDDAELDGGVLTLFAFETAKDQQRAESAA